MIAAARPLIGDEERAAVDEVLRSGRLAQGPRVAEFEGSFSRIVAGRSCVAVNSGTSALILAFKALGIGAGDEVIVPSFTFAATANAVVLAGATPVFADITADTFCLDPAAVLAAITPRTVAILPVHLYGHPADMPALADIAVRLNLAIVEDAAQAHEAALGDTPVGAFGDAAAFSFYPTKNMTSGEGGMVVTRDEFTARTARLLRNQGMEQRYRNEIAGYNMRMTDIHAAIGIVQLRRLHDWNERRREIAAFYDRHLTGVTVPAVRAGARHVYHQYTVLIPEDRDAFAAALAQRGVGSGVYYPTPVHQLPSFGLDLDLPVTQECADHVLSLPVHPGLTDEQVAMVVEAVNGVAKAGA